MTLYQDLLEAIGTRLAAIRTANGYATDVGANCVYRQDLPHEYGDQGGAITWRVQDEGFLGDNLIHTHDLLLEIELIAFVSDGGVLTFESAARADILRLLSIDRTWGGLAKGTQLRKITPDAETQGRTAVRLLAELTVTMRTKLYEA